MKMTERSLTDWINKLSASKPYRITLKKGHGFYDILFWYSEYHFNQRLMPTDLNDELKCQKKVLDLCSLFEKNIHLKIL